jgi:hypothetical protein
VLQTYIDLLVFEFLFRNWKNSKYEFRTAIVELFGISRLFGILEMSLGRNVDTSEGKLVISPLRLETIKEVRPDLFRVVIISLVIDRYPTHKIWGKLTSLYPDELIMLENALLSSLGALSQHGNEEGIRVEGFLDQAPHFEYAARKWITLMKPSSYLATSLELCTLDKKADIDIWLLSSANDVALVTSSTSIGRNIYNIARAVLKYNFYPLVEVLVPGGIRTQDPSVH